MLMILGLVLISGISAVGSASVTGYRTLIAGKIYDSPDFEHAGGVGGAIVHITCNDISKNATSLSDGTYSITFEPNEGCFDTTASAYAEKDDVVSSTQSATIQDYTSQISLYLGVINIALVPEFGFYVGALTLVSAVGVFFLVRKK